MFFLLRSSMNAKVKRTAILGRTLKQMRSFPIAKIKWAAIHGRTPQKRKPLLADSRR